MRAVMAYGEAMAAPVATAAGVVKAAAVSAMHMMAATAATPRGWRRSPRDGR